MISLPNLLKFYSNKKNKVEEYSFMEYLENAGLIQKGEPAEPEETEAPEQAEEAAEAEAEPEPEETPESLAQIYGGEVIREAQEKAEQILREAQEEAALLKAEAEQAGYEEGYQKGYDEGYRKSGVEMRDKMDAECQAYLEEIREIVSAVGDAKEEILQQYKQDLKNIAIAIGEKVIQISLKSSGSVIEKMILAATDKLKTKEWAKLYISRADAELLVRGDRDILRIMARLSDNLKVIAMENEKPGTCIIELPDEIIDASASTQVENIKEILRSTGI